MKTYNKLLIICLVSISAQSHGQMLKKKDKIEEKNYYSYESEKKIDKSREEYSEMNLDDITNLQEQFIDDLVDKNFKEQREIRSQQRAMYLEQWEKGKDILEKEWQRFEKKVRELEDKITAGDVQKNTKVFAQINKAREKSNERIKKNLFDKLHAINENSAQLQVERNIELREKIQNTIHND